MMGIIGLLVFLADLWAILIVIQSDYTSAAKALWCLLILVLPVVGLLVWYVAGPKSMIENR